MTIRIARTHYAQAAVEDLRREAAQLGTRQSPHTRYEIYDESHELMVMVPGGPFVLQLGSRCRLASRGSDQIAKLRSERAPFDHVLII
jgi:hypothetical protein